jgi:prepilin-type processing-associated H-X9-DG protein
VNQEEQEKTLMPIEFTCPHCGTKTTVADQYIGRTGPCGSCGQTITIPGTAPLNYSPPPVRGGGCGTGVVLGVLGGGVLILGLFIALLLPAIQAAREAARRTMCSNNLREIGMAMQQYHDEYGCLPPPYTVDKDGNKLHSWRVLILPYLGRNDIYDRIDLDEPWDSQHNLPLISMMPPVYRCPSNPLGPDRSETDYLMITGPGTVGDGPKGTKKRDIHDGPETTLHVAETAGSGVPWMKPDDFDVATMKREITGPGDRMPDGTISSWHPGVANVLFCDGHVTSLSTEIDPEILGRMLTKDGEEEVNAEL